MKRLRGAAANLPPPVPQPLPMAPIAAEHHSTEFGAFALAKRVQCRERLLQQLQVIASRSGGQFEARTCRERIPGMRNAAPRSGCALIPYCLAASSIRVHIGFEPRLVQAQTRASDLDASWKRMSMCPRATCFLMSERIAGFERIDLGRPSRSADPDRDD